MARRILWAHQGQTQRIDPRGWHRQTDQAPAMGRHKVDGLRRAHLRRDHQIAFILAVLMVHQNEHAPVAGVLDDLLGRRDDIRIICLGHDGSARNLSLWPSH